MACRKHLRTDLLPVPLPSCGPATVSSQTTQLADEQSIWQREQEEMPQRLNQVPPFRQAGLCGSGQPEPGRTATSASPGRQAGTQQQARSSTCWLPERPELRIMTQVLATAPLHLPCSCPAAEGVRNSSCWPYGICSVAGSQHSMSCSIARSVRKQLSCCLLCRASTMTAGIPTSPSVERPHRPGSTLQAARRSRTRSWPTMRASSTAQSCSPPRATARTL